MKKPAMIFIVVIIGVLAVMIFGKRGRRQTVQPGTEMAVSSAVSPSPSASGQTYQSQVQKFGEVEVEALPQRLQTGQKMIFKLSLNTHSVSLDYDYVAIAALRDNRGARYRALAWDGGRGGHHLTGQLTFEPLKEEAEEVTLELAGIDNQTKSFTWKVLK